MANSLSAQRSSEPKTIVYILYNLVYNKIVCTCGEMDITAVFGTVILGSNPGRCTMKISLGRFLCIWEKKPIF